MSALPVSLFGQHTGELALAGPLRSPEDWAFVYAPAYLESPAPIPLSVSLPLRPEPFAGAVVRNWFCNLLPEGGVRLAIEARLRLPPRDDFALLAAIGGECAGAVSVGAPAAVGGDSIDLKTLLGETIGNGDGDWALHGAPRRLSLAGAQDKLAVIVDGNGRLRLPAVGEPSTHLLKPDSLRFRGLRELEALGLALAAAVGLDAARARAIDIGGRHALLIERYDRRLDDGAVQRLHQEDFCQALGYPGELKYEGQGGPGLAAISQLLRRLALGPAALQGLLDAVVFNALIGNADAHAKNLSLLVDRTGRRRLAPLYDLVPTVALPETLVDREPALRIGGATRIDAITADDWRSFARAAGYAPGFVLRRVGSLADAVLAALPRVIADLTASGGDPQRLQRGGDAVQAQTLALQRAAAA